MAYLLDTHTFLWFIENHPSLSSKARTVVEAEENAIFLQKISLWEIAIKTSIGKLSLTKPVQDLIQEAQSLQINLLDISDSAIIALQHLPFHHRDPFDRLLLAEAMTKGLDIVSADAQFDAYAVNRVW
jgi:PIN domain nuclease of toxin-antitoxin system